MFQNGEMTDAQPRKLLPKQPKGSKYVREQRAIDKSEFLMFPITSSTWLRRFVYGWAAVVYVVVVVYGFMSGVAVGFGVLAIVLFHSRSFLPWFIRLLCGDPRDQADE